MLEAKAASVLEACKKFGMTLDGCVTHNGAPVEGARMLWAIAGNESNWGALREYVREEKAYMPGGVYYRGSKAVRLEHQRYGVLASSSYGSFQLMYITATELGYRDHPILLQNDLICAKWATDLILKRFVKNGAKTLADVLDSYNSGNHKDNIIPEEYIRKAVGFYELGLPSNGSELKA